MPQLTRLAASAIVAGHGASPLVAQSSWIPIQWTGPDKTWFTIEYDRNAVRRLAVTLTIPLRRDRLSAMRQDSVIADGAHPWTRQEIELDCTGENWRVVRWEARDETGTLLASGGGATWSLIRAEGYPRALERRLCPWP